MIEYVENGDLALIDGLKFRRDKRTGYYLNRKNQVRLHRYIWEKYNGPIAPGFHIHHIDCNKRNNNIENLAIIEKGEHERLHGSMLTEEQKQKMRDNLMENAVPEASKWHGSKDGREWHRQHYEKMKDALYAKTIKICEYCGKEYETINHGNNRFCSNNCKAAWRRESGVDDEIRNCAFCGKEFTANKYTAKKFCTRECASKYRRSKKR